jgi:hypothetical protein
MFFCLRVDLDYVPWDTPDAAEFGHGEPAMLLRLLDLGRHTGYKFHFFASNRVLRALPATPEAVLNDGHDLDWFNKHPEQAQERYEEAKVLFREHGHTALGMSIKGAWPNELHFPGAADLRFLSAAPGPTPEGLRLFPVDIRTAREGYRSGFSARGWTDSAKVILREHASRNMPATVVIRPQVMAKFDPKLSHVKEILDIAQAAGMPVRTLRDIMAGGG